MLNKCSRDFDGSDSLSVAASWTTDFQATTIELSQRKKEEDTISEVQKRYGENDVTGRLCTIALLCPSKSRQTILCAKPDTNRCARTAPGIKTPYTTRTVNKGNNAVWRLEPTTKFDFEL